MTSLPWLRLWTDFPDDPRIKLLAFDDQRHFLVLLCLKGRGILDSDYPTPEVRNRAIAAGLGLSLPVSDECRRRMLEIGLIADDWQPAKWDQRQFQSDHSAERTRNWRAKRHGDGAVTSLQRHGDAIRAESEQSRADTEQKAKKPRAKARSTIPDGRWLTEADRTFATERCPDMNVDATFDDFQNHHTAKGTLGADWHAAWRTWVGNCVKGFSYVRRARRDVEASEPILTPQQWRELQQEKARAAGG